MPRKKVESVKITGRVSENYLDIEIVDFVRKKLKKMDQAELVREGMKKLYEYEKGDLFKKDLEETLTKVLKNNNINISDDIGEKNIDKETEKEIESEIESQFDQDGNLDFHF